MRKTAEVGVGGNEKRAVSENRYLILAIWSVVSTSICIYANSDQLLCRRANDDF